VSGLLVQELKLDKIDKFLKKIRNNYEDIYPGGTPCVRGIRTGNTLYISGITAFGSKAEGGSLTNQLEVILDRIIRIVEFEGGKASDIVAMTTYIVDSKMSEYEPSKGKQLQIWNQYFKGAWPTNAYIGVSCLAASTVDLEITTTVIFD